MQLEKLTGKNEYKCSKTNSGIKFKILINTRLNKQLKTKPDKTHRATLNYADNLITYSSRCVCVCVLVGPHIFKGLFRG